MASPALNHNYHGLTRFSVTAGSERVIPQGTLYGSHGMFISRGDSPWKYTVTGLPSGATWRVIGRLGRESIGVTFTRAGTYNAVIVLTDRDGETARQSVSFVVQEAVGPGPDPDPDPPTGLVANAGTDQFAASGGSVSLNGAGTTATGRYLWRITSGRGASLRGSTTLTPTLRLPTVTRITRITVRLVVLRRNAQGGDDTAGDTVIITVVPTLAATAGDDRTIDSGGTSLLSGIGSTESVSYSWAIVTGTGGSIRNSRGVEATFQAPTLARGARDRTFTVRLTVFIGAFSATDDVEITVRAPAAPARTLGGSYRAGSPFIRAFMFSPPAASLRGSWKAGSPTVAGAMHQPLVRGLSGAYKAGSPAVSGTMAAPPEPSLSGSYRGGRPTVQGRMAGEIVRTERLIGASRDALWSVDPDGSDRVRLRGFPSGMPTPAGAALLDSRLLVVGEGSLWELDPDGTSDQGRRLRGLPSGLGSPRAMTVLDGRLLVTDSSGFSSLWELDPDGADDEGTELRRLPASVPAPFGMAAYRGRLLVAGLVRDELWEVDPDGGNAEGTKLREFPDDLQSAQGMTAYADNRLLIADSTGNELWQIDPDGNDSQGTELRGLPFAPLALASVPRLPTLRATVRAGSPRIEATLQTPFEPSLAAAYRAGSPTVSGTMHQPAVGASLAGSYKAGSPVLQGQLHLPAEAPGELLVIEGDGDNLWSINPDGLATEGRRLRGLPRSDAAGIVFMGDRLLVGFLNSEIWEVNPAVSSSSQGSRVANIPSTLLNEVEGMTIHDGDLIVGGRDYTFSTEEVIRLNAANLSTGTRIGRLPTTLQSQRIGGLASLGGTLYVIRSDVRTGQSVLYTLDPEDTDNPWTSLGTFPSNVSRTNGMTAVNGELVIACRFQGREALFRVNLSDVSASTNLRTLPSSLGNPTGAAFKPPPPGLQANLNAGSPLVRGRMHQPQALSLEGTYRSGDLKTARPTVRGLMFQPRQLSLRGSYRAGSPTVSAAAVQSAQAGLRGGYRAATPRFEASMASQPTPSLSGAYRAGLPTVRGTMLSSLNLRGSYAAGRPTVAGTMYQPPLKRTMEGSYRAGSPRLAGTLFTTQRPVEGEGPVIPVIQPLYYSVGMRVNDVLPAANGGTPPYSYAVAGDTPQGLTFEGRRVYGFPTEARVGEPTRITVTDDAGASFTRAFQVIVGPSSPPDLILPPVRDRTVFVGDDIDETLPCARGNAGELVYRIEPALEATVRLQDRRLQGRFTQEGETTHRYVARDIVTGLERGSDFTIKVRSLRGGQPAPLVAPGGERFVESRIALLIEPRGTEGQPGYRQGFAWWNGVHEIEFDGNLYQPGEVAGLGSYVVEMQSTEAVTVLLEGADPLFRAWLVAGPSNRDAVVTFLIREGGGAWDTETRYVGRVGECSYNGEEFELEVDASILVPSQTGVTRQSHESQLSIYPDDPIYKNLPTLPGKTEVWPG